MKRLLPWLAVALALWLAGCAMPRHHFTFPPGRTHQDFERDVRLCNLDAHQRRWNEWFGGRTDGQVDRRFVECLTKLGYVETPKEL